MAGPVHPWPPAEVFSFWLQENDVEREFQIHRTEHDYSLAEFWRWTLALLIGVVMGVLGFLVDWGIEKLNNFKFQSTVNSIRSSGTLPCLP